jgi:hypothetical protein
MSDEQGEFKGSELLRAAGRVRKPEPRVLAGAREALWSAIASEMLGTGPAGEQAAAAGRETEPGRATRRRQAGRPQGEREVPAGGGDPRG